MSGDEDAEPVGGERGRFAGHGGAEALARERADDRSFAAAEEAGKKGHRLAPAADSSAAFRCALNIGICGAIWAGNANHPDAKATGSLRQADADCKKT